MQSSLPTFWIEIQYPILRYNFTFEIVWSKTTSSKYIFIQMWLRNIFSFELSTSGNFECFYITPNVNTAAVFAKDTLRYLLNTIKYNTYIQQCCCCEENMQQNIWTQQTKDPSSLYLFVNTRKPLAKEKGQHWHTNK